MSQLFKSALSANLQNIKTKEEIDEQFVVKSIKDSYQTLEKNFYNIVIHPYKLGFYQLSRVGSCALSIFVHDNKLYVANLGDCKGVLCKNDSKNRIVAVKLNHKLNANSKKEQAKLKEKFPDDKEIFVCRRVI